MSAAPIEGRSFLRVAAESCAAGACAGAVVDGSWLAVTGHVPSLWTTFALCQAVTTVWSIGQAIRFRQKWQGVLASYALPALGEGIEIPNRPPTEDREDDR